MKRLLAIPLVIVCWVGAAGLHAQRATVTYDEFFVLDVNQRLQQFEQLTPANKADLLREQSVRWRRLHAHRLRPEQDLILAEVAELIRPEQFEPRSSPRQSHEIDAFMALQKRASRAFTPEELRDAFTTIYGRYIPSQ